MPATLKALLVAAVLAAALLCGAGTAAAAPSCASGPERVGDTIHGTPCADVIHAGPGIAAVYGGGGNDTIVPAPIAAQSECPDECRLGVGSQTFEGGPGNDVVFGERGNDTLNGGPGDDRLYGGIGDDTLRGGPGDDLLSGGHGADFIDGEEGSDYVRGDGTTDEIMDSGSAGVDTLSYSTGVTPGFGGSIGPSGFPTAEEGRGVRLELAAPGFNGNNGLAQFGGGNDKVQAGAFETIVGTPFSDYIVGGPGPEKIYGGGGGDIIEGGGGNDEIFGGAEGDDLIGGEGANIDGGPGEDHCEGGEAANCEPVPAGVRLRSPTRIAVGLQAPTEVGLTQLYLAGSSGRDVVTATYSAGSPATVTFERGSGSAEFDESPNDGEGCTTPATGPAVCELDAPLDSIVLAGLGGNDELKTVGFPPGVSVMLLGGEGSDHLVGGSNTEDVLVDGRGASPDTLEALGRDDALMHNGGADQRLGGEGNDLFLSVSICDGDLLDGGSGRDNSSWTRLTQPVEANLARGEAGSPGAGEAPDCANGQTDRLVGIEDLEGTLEEPDVLYGDAGPNQLLGWRGADSFFAQAGDDSILANSGDADRVIDCGEGNDSAQIDKSLDPAPIGCETVNGVAQTLEEELLPPPPPRDVVPPRTRITAHPPKRRLTRRRRVRVAFGFSANEAGSRFRCKLDRRAYASCRSPRGYRVGRGGHVFRVFAIDAAGNRDASPAVFRFRVKRISGR